MTPQLIAQLVIALGPSAFSFISDLLKVWNKPNLTPEEVIEICGHADKSYAQYRAEALAKLAQN